MFSKKKATVTLWTFVFECEVQFCAFSGLCFASAKLASWLA